MFNHKTGIKVKTGQPPGDGEERKSPGVTGLLWGAGHLFHNEKCNENPSWPSAYGLHGTASASSIFSTVTPQRPVASTIVTPTLQRGRGTV